MSLVAKSLGVYEGSGVDGSRPIVSELVEFAEYGVTLAAQQAKLAARPDLQQGAAARVAALSLCVESAEQVVGERHHHLRH